MLLKVHSFEAQSFESPLFINMSFPQKHMLCNKSASRERSSKECFQQRALSEEFAFRRMCIENSMLAKGCTLVG
jgi:hypothetical protein